LFILIFKPKIISYFSARLQRYLPEAAASLQAGAQHCLPAVATRQRCGRGGQVLCASLADARAGQQSGR